MRRCRQGGKPDPSAGYTLVVMAVATTLLGIMLALALPVWSQAIQREKEAELIFRGMQYAEAIRVFQRRFGRYPVRLQELVEVKPRCIRQLWKDPMTESGNWLPIFVSAQRQDPSRGIGPESQFSPEPQPGAEDAEGRTETGFGSSTPDTTPAGPIIGVRSASRKESIRQFFDRGVYSEWRFTVNLLPMPNPNAQGVIPRVNSDTFGRSLPGVQTPGGQPPGGGLQPGGLPGSGLPPQPKPGRPRGGG